jgi:hypothetical protein
MASREKKNRHRVYILPVHFYVGSFTPPLLTSFFWELSDFTFLGAPFKNPFFWGLFSNKVHTHDFARLNLSSQ